MPMQIKIIWLFAKWCFMKMFGGCFNKAAYFREELKKGAPDSIFAICAYFGLSLLGILILMLVAAVIIPEPEILRAFGKGLFYISILSFVYNVIKAAFECFVDERNHLFEVLKDSN